MTHKSRVRSAALGLGPAALAGSWARRSNHTAPGTHATAAGRSGEAGTISKAFRVGKIPVIVLVAAIAMVAPAVAEVPNSDTAATVSVAGPADGGTFQGIGGLSAGASSRLLIDYPEPQRSRILDYLFKPHYGASLQVLKVEIGGDTDSTAGSEPSQSRTPEDLDCNRGYEWWLMEQAKKRNPNIKLWGLQWGAPNWVGTSIYTTGNIDFLLSWLGCARQHHLNIDMMGGWNERSTSDATRVPWYEQFRARLDAAGYRGVGLLIGDEDGNGSWASAATLAANPDLRNDVVGLGGHYPCRGNPKGTACASGNNVGNPSLAQSLGLPLWASEMGSDNYITGAPGLARAYNRQYIEGRITGAVNWSLAACWYHGVTAYAGDGLLDCETPWSGNYAVDRSLWVTAHTTQFAAPGWGYDTAASGESAVLGGSYVTLKSPDNAQFSTIVETTQATAAQPITLTGIQATTVHVWDTDLGSADPATWFVRGPDLQPADGAVTLTLQPNHIYTLTSTTGQQKGSPASPSTQGWSLPYREDFNAYPYGATPRYFSDQEGTWETAPCDGRGGKCLEQTITAKPVRWRPEPLNPLTVVGDPSWPCDYTVGVDARLDTSPGYVELSGRDSGFDLLGTGLAGYHLRLATDGTWMLFKETTGNRGGNHVDTLLATGSVTRSASSWDHLELAFQGDAITALIDGTPVTTVTDDSYHGGQVGLQIGGYYGAQFDNLTVTPSVAR